MKNFEHLQAQKEEKEAQNTYLRRQLDVFMRVKRRELKSSSSSRRPGSVRAEEEEDEPLSGGSSSGDDAPRYPRRELRQVTNFNEFKVDILEFEGKLDPVMYLALQSTKQQVKGEKGATGQ